jgi:hypothetical protein
MVGLRMIQRVVPFCAAGFAAVTIHWLSGAELLVGHDRVLVVVALICASLVIIWLPGLAGAALIQGHASPALLLSSVVVGSGLTGWLLFWTALAGWGPTASLAIAAVSAVALAVRPVGGKAARCLAAPLLTIALLAVGYVAIAGDHGGLDRGSNTMAYRYWVVPDNQLPELFAVKLLDGQPLGPYITGDWQASDRPPLETGMMLTGYPLAPRQNRAAVGLLLSLVINLTWVLGLWSLLRSLGVADRRVMGVVLTVALAGTVYVNTVYAWPKMLAGGLVLVAAAALLDKATPAWLRWPIVGAASALALLSHGAAAFGLVALVPFVWTRRHEIRWRHVAAGVGVAAVVYAPWAGFQHFYAPPGDRLVKWHLAGTDIEKIDRRPPLQAIVAAYRSAGPQRVVAAKLTNMRLMAGDPTTWSSQRGHWTPAWDAGVGTVREVLLTQLGPSPAALLAGLPLIFLRRVRRAAWCTPLIVLTGLSGLTYALLEWGGRWEAAAWLHTAPYSLILLWVVLGGLAVAEVSTRLLVLLAVGQAAVFGALWVRGVTLQSAFTANETGHRDLQLDLLAVLAFAAVAILSYLANDGKLTIRPWDLATRPDRAKTLAAADESSTME